MITNASKPTTTLANADRIASFETWATIPTTWASETRVWFETSSVMTNSTFSDFLIWSFHTYPWREALPWQLAGSGITNVNKP